jgi:hypothetical protein
MVGYEIEEKERDYEQKGITGEVSRGAVELCKFPCIILYSTDEQQLPKYKLSVLSAMMKSNEVSKDLTEKNNIHLYLTNGVKTARLGGVSGRQIKSILSLFEGCRMDAYLNKDKKLEGQYIYVLSD